MSEIALINERIFQLKREILRKQREIDGLKSEILRLEISKREMQMPEPIFEEEYFVIPKRVFESYLESIL